MHDAPLAVDLQAGGGIQHELGAGGFGLLLDQGAQVEARDALREAREILDLFDVEHLPAAGQVLDEDGPQPKAPAIHGRRQPRQPAADDRQVVLVRHVVASESMGRHRLAAPSACAANAGSGRRSGP